MSLTDVNQLQNWKSLSEATQNVLTLSQKSGLDSVGLFMAKQFNPNELLSIFQTLADPKLAGPVLSTTNWDSKNLYRVKKIADNVAPYDNSGRYNCYPLISTSASYDRIQFPLVTNYLDSNIYNGATKCPKYEKLLKIFTEKLKKPVVFLPLSTNGQFVREKKTYEIFSKLNYGSNFELNEFDKIVLLASITADELTNDYIANHSKAFKKETASFNKNEQNYINTITKDLLTLAIVRTIDLGNPNIAYKIDEALKLQISNDLALMAGAGSEITKYIAHLTENAVVDITEKLDFSLERIKKNMLDMGFKYPREPKNVLETIFNVGNLEKTYGVEANAVKEQNAPKVENKVQQKVFHALSGAVLAASVTKMKLLLPSYIDEQILTKKQHKELNDKLGFETTSSEECLAFTLEKEKDADKLYRSVSIGYGKAKAGIVEAVVNRFAQQRDEDFGKSTKQRLNDTLNETYNNTDKRKRSGTIIRKIVKDQIKEAKTKEIGKE